jgi:phosphopantothenoylcysteine decarboxylase/phosphopantothenate--cysteine ligase
VLKGKKILLCVTGSIAVYKSVILVRLLVKAGAEVKVIMTESAKDFVTPLTFSTLSKNKVLTDLFDEGSWVNHVMLGRWADVMLIAPASCNTIAKMANGTCDNLLLAVYLSSKCAVVIAPAMDEDMWLHPATKQNIEVLKKQGNEFLAVNNGELASGLTGEGRMMEPEKIMDFLEDYFSKDTSLKGINALVTAGPTYEAIDPVRFIGNHSSGKMGAAIAEELFKRGANVQLVIGPSDIQISSGINTKKVVSADEMYEACMQQFDSYDIIIMAAAVADFTPKKKAVEKIKKSGEGITLELVRTKDILLKSGQSKTKNQTVVGFALETNNEKANAIEKLKAKNADMIILNSLKDERAGFGYDTNKITIFDKNNKEYQFPAKTKKQVATDIVNTITQYRNE